MRHYSRNRSLGVEDRVVTLSTCVSRSDLHLEELSLSKREGASSHIRHGDKAIPLVDDRRAVAITVRHESDLRTVNLHKQDVIARHCDTVAAGIGEQP